MEYVMTGHIQTRVHQYLTTLKALEIEVRTGMAMSGRGPILQAAKRHGYVPESFRTKKQAIRLMSYVRTVLAKGGFATLYAEEIITEKLMFDSWDNCGCPTFMAVIGKTNRLDLMPLDRAVMCIHKESE